MGPMEHPYFWWGGMWLFPILFLIVVVLAAYLIARRGGMTQRAGGAETPVSEPALEIAKKRYAKGEISREDFLEMKKDLAG